jgi:hypothetical protein
MNRKYQTSNNVCLMQKSPGRRFYILQHGELHIHKYNIIDMYVEFDHAMCNSHRILLEFMTRAIWELPKFTFMAGICTFTRLCFW